LAEVFENYRESCMKMFGLDPARLCPFNRWPWPIGWNTQV
jgi:hypothetical protein